MIPVDLNRLREARGRGGVLTVTDATLDAVLGGRRIWWCVEHLANATEYGECMGASMQRMALHQPFPCKKERSVVVPVKGES